MSSGSIDAQERSELEAAEKGIRLTRPAGYTRQTRFTWLTPEQIARESPIMLDHWQRLEDEHQRTHQATVEYLQRKALGERVSRQQLADEYGVTVHMIRWRLRLYRGYDTTKKEAEYRRRKEEREAQIRESGMYAPALLYDHFMAELARKPMTWKCSSQNQMPWRPTIKPTKYSAISLRCSPHRSIEMS
jgi:hypothetical protein